MSPLAQELIDYAEIHLLDVQPLTEWQRWVIEKLCQERTRAE